MVQTMSERRITFKDREVERGRGCWNCIHWDNGDGAKMSYKLRTDRRGPSRIGDVGNLSGAEFSNQLGQLMRQGYSQQQGIEILIRQKNIAAPRASVFDKMIDEGAIGLCRGGGVDKLDQKVDFVEYGHLCHKWTGRDGHSVATAGKTLDKLPDELAEIVESKAKKR
jgi:hypothetical protein